MKRIEFVCDSLLEAQDMAAYCQQKQYGNIQLIPLTSLQIIEVEGDRPQYKFRTRIYMTNDMGGAAHLVTAQVP